jgi:uncharacterized protein (DUF305 family)
MAPKSFLALAALLVCSSVPVLCQQNGVPAPVQPGAPGQPSTTLNAITATPPAKAPSEADIRFMQDMIMHHGQAVEMTELAKTRAQNPEVKDIASKIDLSQGDEIRWMKQWLEDRGIAVETMGSKDGMAGMHHDDMASMSGMDYPQMQGMDHPGMAGMDHGGVTKAAADPMDVAMMPGMLTPRQMATLRKSSGKQFDILFLTGMMQHHNGALLMVKDLFQQPGAGQDPQLFDFANDVDNTQLAEIDIMKGILRKVNQ